MQRYLIDTNIFVFYAVTNDYIDRDVRQILEDYESEIYISSESVKEVIHLFQTGRIKTQKWKNTQDIFNAIENESNFTIKYVKREHLLTLASLEVVENHNDPSDRLIIAQAITEKMPLISSDTKFEHYRKQQLNFVFNRK
jgi:PIN domain nuclease of toxin-antitoxin system